MLFDDYNESDVLIATVSGTLKEWVIIQNALRQIKSTEIETTLFIAGGIRLNRLFHGRQKKNDEIDKRPNTRIMLSGLQWKGPSFWQSKNKGLD